MAGLPRYRVAAVVVPGVLLLLLKVLLALVVLETRRGGRLFGEGNGRRLGVLLLHLREVFLALAFLSRLPRLGLRVSHVRR